MLEINNLCVNVDGKDILKDITLTVKPGKIHAIMGPNGAGKSTLLKTIVGSDDVNVARGSVVYKGHNLLDLSVEERARLGIFLSFQSPIEIPGLSVMTFLKEAYNEQMMARQKTPLAPGAFIKRVNKLARDVGLDQSFLKRSLNVGFSGGERKRLEILQLLIFEPELVLLDEVDSGLDSDAARSIAQCLKSFANHNVSILMITHYERFLKSLEPHEIHVLIAGQICQSGDLSIVQTIEKEGYDAF